MHSMSQHHSSVCAVVLQIPSPVPLPTMLLDLLRCSTDQTLVRAAFGLLVKFFTRMQLVLTALSQVNLLPTDDAVKVCSGCRFFV